MTDLNGQLSELSPEQRELFAMLQGTPDGTSAPQEQRLPLTFAQQRVWFIGQNPAGSLAYHVPFAFRIAGPLDVNLLQSALDHVVQRHDALRATISCETGDPIQVIAAKLSVPLPVVDFRRGSATSLESEALKLIAADVRIPFDFEHGPLIRAKLFQLRNSEWVFLITVHHCVFDGHSAPIFFGALSAAYEACRNGNVPRFPHTDFSYASLVQAELREVSGEVLTQHLQFWKEQLAGAPPFLELPSAHQRPAAPTYRGANYGFDLPVDLSQDARSFARQEGVTLFMVLLAAYQSVLFRHTQQEEIIVGTAAANRNRIDSESVVGFFASSIPLRTSFAGDPTFLELLHRVRDMAADAYAHDETPFEKIVAAIQSPRDPGRNPIFQHMFLLQGKSLDEEFALPGLGVSRIAIPFETAMVDMTFAVRDGPQGLSADIEYSTDLFDAPSISRFAGHFANLLRAAIMEPAKRVSELTLLSEAERHQLICEWNATESGITSGQCVHELFEARVEETPDAVAVEFGDQQWSYREVNSRANQLARRLQKLGVGPDVPVGFCIERSATMIIGLLGILKAGGSYVALDASWPDERLTLILRETNAPLLLTVAALESRFCGTNAAHLCIDPDFAMLDREDPGDLRSGATPAHLAYISFTSGSTGEPRGVCVPHRAVTRLVRYTHYARLGSDETFLQLAPLAFDASTFEIWGALLNGARLAIYPPQPLSLSELGDALRKHAVTTLWLTAGLFQKMVESRIDDLRGVRQLLSGGDVLSVTTVRAALGALPGCTLINGYGPTENTTFTCCHRITSAPAGRSIPIGRPIASTTVYIVDRHMQPVPIGVPGELCTGGAGLARCYLNSPELSAEKFVPDPFSNEPGARLYKTGDLARFLADGTIEFLGRMDRQVKIRGHRVERGEIETVLRSHPGVKECAVVARRGPDGENLLAAFIVPKVDTSPFSSGLRDFLARKLPEPLIPSVFATLAALPLTPNGKLDQDALQTMDVAKASDKTSTTIAPRNAIEQGVARIWERVLARKVASVREDFFTVGGHSLLSLRLLAEIRNEFGIKIPARRLFEAPTIEGLAACISEQSKPSADKASAWHFLVQVQPGAPSATPLFLVPGGWGGEIEFLVYAELSRHLDPSLPIWGFKARGAGTAETPHKSASEMAADYLTELRAIQAHGPYFLAGECVGGICAYEMACQLEEAGEQVALLMLFDTMVPAQSLVHEYLQNESVKTSSEVPGIGVQQRIRHHWDKMRCLSLGGKFGYLLKKATRRESPAAISEVPTVEQYPRGQKEYPVTLMRHTLRPYRGTVTLLRDEESARLYGDFGWESESIGKLEMHTLPGDHISYIREKAPTAVVKVKELISRAVARTQS